MTTTVTKSANNRGRPGEQPALGVGLTVERVFSTEGVHPYDEVTWQSRDVVQTNWKTGEVVFEQRGVEFVPGTGKSPRTAQTQETKGDTSKSQAQGGENAAQTKKEQRRNTWTNEDGSIRPISKWSGVSFTDQQKADYVAGKAVKLENVTDKQGFHATMYIKFNPEKGRPYRYDTNPDNAQQVAPSNESRTQVAVNNDGKTNEATKNLREPLQKGQTNPKDARQQQQQEKPQKKTGKGMKM